MKNSTGPVWVIVDQEDCQILPVSLQLIGHARKMANKLDVDVEAVLLGNNIKNNCNCLFEAGSDRIYIGESHELNLYQPDLYTDIIVNLSKEKCPQIMLFGSTIVGRELAPLIAAILQTGLTAHCIDLVINDKGIMEQKIPAYGGLMTIVCPEKRPQMATVAQGVFSIPDISHKQKGEIVRLKIPILNTRRVEILQIVRDQSNDLQLETAAAVVAGGAGAGDIDGWNQIVDLSKVLGAALGCTRPAADEGWTDLETMIGQSGKMISPEVYIGIGLSGELQHMVGISEAQLMIAINNDPKAPIFHQVDYGIIDDCKEFVPVLIERIKSFRKHSSILDCRKCSS
ncbi:electron transfer flavoprotein subunit alpha/FixB family protein [Thermodesulfobacteriota bacterium]